MSIFFTADTHFGQERTLELSKRPFKDVDHMNDAMINRWNKTVKDEDVVYHLGDFGDIEIAEQLYGNIVLIKGNYETDGDMSDSELKKYFSDVRDDMVVRIPGLNPVIKLVHEPLKMDDKVFNLFGHIHKLQMVKRKGLNVGTDCHNFTPIDVETVEFYRNAIDNFYDDNVFCE